MFALQLFACVRFLSLDDFKSLAPLLQLHMFCSSCFSSLWPLSKSCYCWRFSLFQVLINLGSSIILIWASKCLRKSELTLPVMNFLRHRSDNVIFLAIFLSFIKILGLSSKYCLVELIFYVFVGNELFSCNKLRSLASFNLRKMLRIRIKLEWISFRFYLYYHIII